jgi:hypothetical protein
MRQALVLSFVLFSLWTPVGSLDMKLKGERVYIQREVESILVRNDLTNPRASVINLDFQINGALVDIILAEKIRGKGSAKVRQILSKWLQITQMGQDRLDNLFDQTDNQNGDQNQDFTGRDKRAFEFLGDLMSGLTGVPSADMHREVLEKLDLLKLDNEGARELMARTNKVTKEILHKLHFHEKRFNNFHTKIELVEKATLDLERSIDLILSLIAFQQTTAAEIYKLDEIIFKMNNILLTGRMNLLSKYAIDETVLSSLIEKISVKNTELAPAIPPADSAEIYELPVTHSWSDKNTDTIYSLIQIPMIDFNDPQEVMILPTSLTLHPEMDIVLIDRIKNVYRFLSDSEYKNCLKIKKVSVCQKRYIEIFPDEGCDIHGRERLDCNRWDKLVIHDLHNTELLLHFKDGPQNATLECKGEQAKSVQLPGSGVLRLGGSCRLRNENFWIHELTYSRFTAHETNSFEISNPKWMTLQKYASVTHIELEKAENKTDKAVEKIEEIDSKFDSTFESAEREFDRLFKFNDETLTMIEKLDSSSQSKWEEIEAKRRTLFEKYTTWAIIGSNILLSIFLLGCLMLQSKRQSGLTLTMNNQDANKDDTKDRIHAIEERVTGLEAWTELNESKQKK